MTLPTTAPRTLLAALLLAGATALTGCVAAAPPGPASATSSAPSTSTSTSTPTPSAAARSDTSRNGSLHYPDGASSDTPECQDASAAAVAAVNATIDNPLPGGANDVAALTATPDPDHAVWLLTGVVASTSTTEGALVSWATTADPTQDVFEGTLRSVGGVTANLSSAPVLQFADVKEAGGFPPAALHCAATMPRDSSR